MRGHLEGTRLTFKEATEVTFAAGWRRKPLAQAVATFAWESAFCEAAYLDYEYYADESGHVFAYDHGSLSMSPTGEMVNERMPLDPRRADLVLDGRTWRYVYRQDQGFCQINSLHKPTAMGIEEWETKVFKFATNADLGRSLYETDLSRGGSGFRPWAAFTNGNYLRSYRQAKHWAANVDAQFYASKLSTFRWWEQKWIPGDKPVWDAERIKRGFSTRWQSRWAGRHPYQAMILVTPTLRGGSGAWATGLGATPLQGAVGTVVLEAS